MAHDMVCVHGADNSQKTGPLVKKHKKRKNLKVKLWTIVLFSSMIDLLIKIVNIVFYGFKRLKSEYWTQVGRWALAIHKLQSSKTQKCKKDSGEELD